MANQNNDFAGSLNANFKNVYAGKIQNLIPEGLILLKMIPFAPRDSQPGLQYNQPVTLSHEQGFTYGGTNGSAFNLNAPVAGNLENAVIRGSEMVLRSTLSYGAISRAKDGGVQAFINSTKYLVQNMLESFTKRLEIQLFYGNSGLAAVDSISGNAITITTAQWAPGIWAGAEGAPLEIRSAAGVLRGYCSVSSVNMDTRVITVDVAPAGVVATDVIYYKGSFGNEFSGLYDIITTSGSLFGINTASFNLFKGNTYAVTGSLQFSHIEGAISRGVEKGLQRKVMVLCNVRSWVDLLTEQTAKRIFKEGAEKEYSNGAQSIKFFGQNGEIEIRPSIYVKESHAFVIAPDELERIGSSEVTFERPGRREEFFRELENSAGFELRAYCDQALFCYRPGYMTLISGIVN